MRRDDLGCIPTYTLLPMNRLPSSTKLPDKTEPGDGKTHQRRIIDSIRT
jgi:hypothetical protein